MQSRKGTLMTDPVAIALNVLEVEGRGLDALKASFAPDHASGLRAEFTKAIEAITQSTGRVVVTGMGKSGHVGRKIAATLASTGEPASFVHPGEASHGDLGMVHKSDVVIALSNSGETPELMDIIGYCGRFSIPLIGITSGTNSTLANASNIKLLLPEAEEACTVTKAPTTSTTLSLVLGDALAVALLKVKGFGASDFQNYHPGGKLGAALRRVDQMMHGVDKIPLAGKSTPVSEAVKIMSLAGFGCVGITDHDGSLVGVITDGDLRRNFEPSLPARLAEEVMTKNPITVSPDSLAAEALGILSRKKVTALFVTRDGKPVGLLHVHDCLASGVI